MEVVPPPQHSSSRHNLSGVRFLVYCWLGRMEGDGTQSGAASVAKERRKVEKRRRKKLAKAALSSTNCKSRTPSTPPSEGHSRVTAEAEEAAAISGKKRPRDRAAGGKSNTVFTHPFPTEYGDHFETPLQAYRDVQGALGLLAKLLGKKRKHLRIWDPYVSETRTRVYLVPVLFFTPRTDQLTVARAALSRVARW